MGSGPLSGLPSLLLWGHAAFPEMLQRWDPSRHLPKPPVALFIPAPPSQPRRPWQNTEFFLKDTGTTPSLLPFLWVSPLSALEPELGQLYDLLSLREHLAKTMQGETGKATSELP